MKIKNFCVKAFRFRLIANGKIQFTFDEMSPEVLKSWYTGDLCRARKLIVKILREGRACLQKK